MPALSNQKFERYAFLVDNGMLPSEAYAQVHPKSQPKHASSNVTRFLKKHPEITARLAEMAEVRLQASAQANAYVSTRAQEIAAISKGYVLSVLKEVVERCMQHKPVFDRDGGQVFVELPSGQVAAAYEFDPKSATRALQLLGMEIGMFVQRVRVEKGIFDDLPASVVQQIMEALAGMLGGRTLDNEASGAIPPAVPQLDSSPPS
jgi:hypothetical protein